MTPKSPESQASSEKVRKPRHRDIPAARALAIALLPEVRHFSAEGLEVRAASKGVDEIVITGRPIVYDAPYTVRDQYGSFEETIHRGAAADVVGGDVRFLFNHDGLPMARTSAGTLQLEDRADGVYFTARLDARQQLANDLSIAIQRGDVSQMSVGFNVKSDDNEWDDEGDTVKRSIYRLNTLLDVSAVTYPCSPSTSIEVAKRMALQIPIETLARTQQMAIDLRAGKVLSTANQARLVDAVASLHQVLDLAGFDPLHLIEKADDEIYPESEVEGDPNNADGGTVTEDGREQLDATDTGVRALQLEAEMLALHAARRRH